MFKRVLEVGKTISADNLKVIQSIHDSTGTLGADCGGVLGGMYEAATEAALPMNTSHDALRSHIRAAVMAHHGVSDTYNSSGPYIHDVFPTHVVYSLKGQTYKHKYTSTEGAAGSDPTIALNGEPKKVHVAYVDSTESAKEAMRLSLVLPKEYSEDYTKYEALRESKNVIITLSEATVRESSEWCQNNDELIEALKEGAKTAATSGKPTLIPIKIIAPGWGSMAYYSKEMIQESGPKTFRAGTQMFWNHATSTQENERPEGDLNDLAAVLVKNAKWEDSGPKGPGLYSEAKVFSDYAQQVTEKGPHIGVSINAGIKCHEGEAEGKAGRIADAFVHAFSADFVTKAGAGGAPIVPVTESRRSPEPKEISMTDQEKAEFEALKAENNKLKEGQNLILAVATVGSVLKEAGVQFSQKLLERACANPVMKEGKVDLDWVKGIVADFTDGQTAGVQGMGSVREGARRGHDAAITKEEEERFQESLKELNIPEAGLKFAAMVGGK